MVAYGGGHWLDRAGPRVVFGTGAAVYVAGYRRIFGEVEAATR
ncbi:MAG TPA: hypothetical protein VFL66_00520 [Gaiellaceae bacterium]|nr:hypothetical protein [Gaiellaceae bacterium]